MLESTEARLAAEAIDRLASGTLAAAESVMAVDTSRYTCAEELAAEKTTLFLRHPLPLALGCEISEPGDYLALDVAGVPVLLIRDDNGTAQGLFNACCHRGARLLDGSGSVGKVFLCPYHHWAYDRCGVLRAQPASEHFPGIETGEAGLVRFPAEERHGIVWLLLNPSGALDLDTVLGAFGPELGALDLANHHLRGIHESSREINWKLCLDSLLESYHVPYLHRASVGSLPFSDVFLFDTCGRHSRLVLPRFSIRDQQDNAPETWRLLPHATVGYRLFPNSLLFVQSSYVELLRFFPDPERPDSTSFRFSFASPAEDDSGRDWEKLIQIVLSVRNEDFDAVEGVQTNLAAGVLRQIVFGRNEIGLQNFHEMRDAALADCE